MKNILLSIDWDYFISIKEDWTGSYLENRKNIIGLWYKRYFKSKLEGINIESTVQLDKQWKVFWKIIKEYFVIKKSIPIYVSESHKKSYDIAKKFNCDNVYSFDAHSDLGYGGLESLKFEVNCANWLGKLFSDGIIEEGNIVYSKHTKESEEEFKEISSLYNVNFIKKPNKQKLPIKAIHICRSGAWTPPWMDTKFQSFVKSLGLPYENIDCEIRQWDAENLTLADRLNYIYI